MAVRELTESQLQAKVDTRHDVTGLLYPPDGLQPYYAWLMRSLHLLAESSFGQLRVTEDDSVLTAIHVARGRANLAGAAVSHGGSVHDLAAINNQTVLIWLADAGSGVGEVGLAPSTTGWPTGTHLKLAEVTLEAGTITSIVDRRFESALRAD